MRVTITDGLAEELTAQLRGRGTLDAEVERRLTETLHAPDGRVVLSMAELEAIAQRLGTGLPIRNKQDLQRTVEAMARITLGDVRLTFTPPQLELIQERAQKIGDTPERFIARVASKVLTDIFLVQPAGEGVFYTPGFEPEDENDDTGPPLDVTDEPR